MAERMTKRRQSSRLSRSASAESADVDVVVLPKPSKPRSNKLKRPKERWLLTRKTWRYMTDAGRKLIPDGVHNRPEDIPKIEAYFQEVCKREPRFLLWRKNSYPGALAFRRTKSKARKGGSCRKASSADEVDDLKPERPKDLPLFTSGGRFDIQKMKYDFLHSSPSTSSPRSSLKNKETYPTSLDDDEEEDDYDEEEHDDESQLITMLERYLHIEPEKSSTARFNYAELIERLQRHLSQMSIKHNIPYNTIPSSTSSTTSSLSAATTTTTTRRRTPTVHFDGDHVQKSLSETLSRYFAQRTNRDKIISDLLTNRKELQKLYFDLRRAKGFKGRDYTSSTSQSSPWEQVALRPTHRTRLDISDFKKSAPPPLIEIQGESVEPLYEDYGVQTLPISDEDLNKLEEEYRKNIAEQQDDGGFGTAGNRRRSSVDHDDVSQSVSDTIKRYLRMARKKSGDGDKADRFKRVNYDRNLRNIKAKGEITKPGDDDGLNKGCQTNDDWMLIYRDLKFDECAVCFSEASESQASSARSSFDAGVLLHEHQPHHKEITTTATTASTSSPTSKSHSFLSSLLYGKHAHDGKSSTGAAMQKSKSSSSVVHHGSRLMAKTLFKRSKSQSRAVPQTCTWTPKGSCVWNNTISGRQVVLAETTLQQLSEIERKILQKVALAKLQALNLGVTVKIPSETTAGSVAPKKRRPYLLKRKALTTGIFDTGRKDLEKATGNGLVFGIPLSQCVENDRMARVNAAGGVYQPKGSDDEQQHHQQQQRIIGRTPSRASFSSLIDAIRPDEKGSCESLARERILGSVPGLLDTLSCSSTADIIGTTSVEEEKIVPNLLNECIRHLEAFGLHTLGIFRVSSSKKRVRQLREDFDSGKETTLSDDQCPHDVATLLKEFLRDLPDPLLCRDLYHAFVQTQRIRNRRLQLEALQHLVQLLPSVNRDTLYVLINFLSNVSKHANDQTNAFGEPIIGNKMNATNLATVFAPNILHAIKHGAKEGNERPDDRIDVINVIRSMIDSNQTLYVVSAELLDEVYVHMMDTHPEALEELLNKKESVDESQDEISDGSLWSPIQMKPDQSIEDALEKIQDETNGKVVGGRTRRIYSREECLHETAATGGPNVAMRVRHKERMRDRSLKRRKEIMTKSSRRDDDSGSSTSSVITTTTTTTMRTRDATAYTKTRSSSLESSSSLNEQHQHHPQHEIITASLTIPVQTASLNVDDTDIPYIEDDVGKQQHTIVEVIRSPTAPPRRLRQRSISGSDSSVASVQQPIVTGSIALIHQQQQQHHQGYDSAVGSSITHSSPPHCTTTPSSIGSSIADASGMCSSPPSWASTPPTSPDSKNTTVNYIPDDIPPMRYKGRQQQQQHGGGNKDVAPMLQKVSYTSTSEIQRAGKPADIRRDQPASTPRKKSIEIQKCLSTPAFTGNDVLRSRTADFERITRTTMSSSTTTTSTTTTTTNTSSKKYTKRRYTDSRHQTRHIPDSETLDTQQQASKTMMSTTSSSTAASSQQPIYKRRELISSVPSASQR